MAKKQNLNPNDDDFGKEIDDEDNKDVQKKGAGLTDAERKKFRKEYLEKRQVQADAGSPVQTIFKKIEEKGSDRAAFKDAVTISEMEPIKAMGYWRELIYNLKLFGFFDQEDIVDQANGTDVNPEFKKKKAA